LPKNLKSLNLTKLKQVALDRSERREQARRMKTFPLGLLCVSGFIFLSASLFNVRAADTNPPPRLTVELRDGSRVVGTGLEKNFKFHSALLGDFKLDVTSLRSVECLSSNAAKLSTVNGDVLTVSFVDSSFAVKTSFGKVELAVASVRQFTVSAVSNAGRMREGLVGAWLGEGDKRAGVIMVPNSPELVSMQQTRQLTFTVWIKPNSIAGPCNVLLGKGGNQPNGAYGGYEFYLNSIGDNDIIFVSGPCVIDTYGANGRWINNHLGEWIHVAFTINDQTKTAKFYVNGQPTNDEFDYGTYFSSKAGLNFDVTNNLYIGRPDPASNANRSRFDGEMRDVLLFNRALSANEIHELYEAGHSN
jgi:hypothetical protein